MNINTESGRSSPLELSFKRYYEYEGEQTLERSKEKYIQNEQAETQVIMFPPRITRSTSLNQTKKFITHRNIGESLENIPRLGQRNVYSRQNIQLVNKKMKQVKESMLQYANLKQGNQILYSKEGSKDIKLTGKSKNLADLKLSSLFNKKGNNISTTPNHKYPFASKKIQQSFGDEQSALQPKLRKNQSVKYVRNPPPEEVQIFKTTFEPQIFRTTLKKKFVDDNPKILANIIRRKAQNMSTTQVQNFIKHLIHRAKA